jgi:hypothetical protein
MMVCKISKSTENMFPICYCRQQSVKFQNQTLYYEVILRTFKSLSDECNITVPILIILPCALLVKYCMGKRAVLSVREKNEVCAYSDQFPAASQQNSSSHFSIIHGKSINQDCTGDTLRRISGKIWQVVTLKSYKMPNMKNWRKH